MLRLGHIGKVEKEMCHLHLRHHQNQVGQLQRLQIFIIKISKPPQLHRFILEQQLKPPMKILIHRSDSFPTVPNILKFYSSDATKPSEPFYRPAEEVENEVEEEASNYGFEDGSQFFNDSEVFPQFIKNTVVEFSNPSGEDGKKNNLKRDFILFHNTFIKFEP